MLVTSSRHVQGWPVRIDLIGATLGQYHILEPIGHGGMAAVYKARQSALDRFVAIKVLLPHQADSAEFNERFSREAKAIAQLNHPNILPIIDYGQAGDLSYIAMKYVPGGTLAERLKQPLDLATSARLITQIAAALELLIAQRNAIINTGGAGALADLLSRFNSLTLTAEQRIQLQLAQGQVNRIRGEYTAAVTVLEAALEAATDEALRAEILLQIRIVHVIAGEYADSTRQLLDSLKRYEPLGQMPGIANAHRYLGWAHYRQGRFDQAQQHFDIGEQIALQLHDRRLLADVGVGLGSVLWKKSSLAEAQSRFEESRRIFRELDDRFGESNALDNLGINYGDRGDLPRRILQHLQAVHIDEGLGNVYGLSLSLNNLAYAYLLNKQYEDAVKSYTRLAQLSRDLGYTLSLACAGLADAYLALGQLEAALQQAEAAQRNAEQAGGQLERGVSYRVLDDVWRALYATERARHFFEQSIPLLASAGEAEELARAQRGLAQARPEQSKSPEA